MLASPDFATQPRYPPMASDPDFVAYVCEQMRGAGSITSKKMFGEYGLYIDGVIFALVCDNQLFIKPTPAGRAWLGDALREGHAYPGSKLYFTAGAHVEDARWLTELARVTARDLPAPRIKPAGKAVAKKAAMPAAAKKAVVKKAGAKKAVPKQAAVKKVSPKKTMKKRSAPNQAAEKATRKKTSAKKPATGRA
jgi:hypothetical protein